MELTKEHQKLIKELLKIEDINAEFKNKKQEVDKMLTTLLASKIDIVNRENKLEAKEKEYEEKSNQRLNKLLEIQDGINSIIKEKSKSFPWLSAVFTDYINLQDNKLAEFLITKKNPALVAAEKVKEIANEKRILTKQLLLTKYRINYYETLFPFLTEYIDDNIDDLLLQIIKENEKEEVENDPVKRFITQGEYENLGSTERNQKALDRYLSSRKTPYQIGRDYERYIGYKYEMLGFDVVYHGIAEGVDDLGRDLICKKDGKVEVIQCKYWASHKTIHEKHINQLFGTTVKFFIDYYSKKENNYNHSMFPDLLREGNIKPVFITSTKLSDTAKKFADTLGIEVFENEPLKEYPIIKCHTNKITGEKIYHLPFDQMYDKTIIEKKFGEYYAMTVQEAESKGFRRAWKWKGHE
jgi:hypothetical protein